MDLLLVLYVGYCCYDVWLKTRTNIAALKAGKPVVFGNGDSFLIWSLRSVAAVLWRSLREGAAFGVRRAAEQIRARRAGKRAARHAGTPLPWWRGLWPAAPPGHGQPSSPDPRRPHPDDQRPDGRTRVIHDDRPQGAARPDGAPVRCAACGLEARLGDPLVDVDGAYVHRSHTCHHCGEPAHAGDPLRIVDAALTHQSHTVAPALEPHPPGRPPAAGEARDVRPDVPWMRKAPTFTLDRADADNPTHGAPVGPPTRGGRSVQVIRTVTERNVKPGADGVRTDEPDGRSGFASWADLGPDVRATADAMYAAQARADAATDPATKAGATAEALQHSDAFLGAVDAQIARQGGPTAPRHDQHPGAGPNPAAAGGDGAAPTDPQDGPQRPPLRLVKDPPASTEGDPAGTAHPNGHIVPPEPRAGTPREGNHPMITSSGETTNISSTRLYYAQLSEHVSSDITPQIELSQSTLSAAEMADPAVMGAIAQAREAFTNAKAAADGVLNALEAHRLMEQAVASTDGAAKTDFYRGS